MHSKTKGDIGLLATSLFFAQHGYSVFKEIGDLSRVDLIVEKDKKFIKIQCKAMHRNNGVLSVSFISSGPGYKFKYEQDDFDFMSVLDLEDDQLYLVSSSYNDGRTGLALRKDFPYRVQSNMNFADDFLAAKILAAM